MQLRPRPASVKAVDMAPADPPPGHRGDPRMTGDDELIEFLEPDQLSADTRRPVPRARLSPRVRAALWALRIFTLLVGAMVIYTFVQQL